MKQNFAEMKRSKFISQLEEFIPDNLLVPYFVSKRTKYPLSCVTYIDYVYSLAHGESNLQMAPTELGTLCNFHTIHSISGSRIKPLMDWRKGCTHVIFPYGITLVNFVDSVNRTLARPDASEYAILKSITNYALKAANSRKKVSKAWRIAYVLLSGKFSQLSAKDFKDVCSTWYVSSDGSEFGPGSDAMFCHSFMAISAFGNSSLITHLMLKNYGLDVTREFANRLNFLDATDQIRLLVARHWMPELHYNILRKLLLMERSRKAEIDGMSTADFIRFSFSKMRQQPLEFFASAFSYNVPSLPDDLPLDYPTRYLRNAGGLSDTEIGGVLDTSTTTWTSLRNEYHRIFTDGSDYFIK